MNNPTEVVDVEGLFTRVKDLARFARSVLHLPFPDLDKVNPSFGVLAKACELIASILKEENHHRLEHAESLAETMRDIAEAVTDRDDKILIDSMAILDEWLERLAATGASR